MYQKVLLPSSSTNKLSALKMVAVGSSGTPENFTIAFAVNFKFRSQFIFSK
jgi:hypothetical protein